MQHSKLRNKRIILCTSLDPKLCTNAAFLIAAYTVPNNATARSRASLAHEHHYATRCSIKTCYQWMLRRRFATLSPRAPLSECSRRSAYLPRTTTTTLSRSSCHSETPSAWSRPTSSYRYSIVSKASIAPSSWAGSISRPLIAGSTSSTRSHATATSTGSCRTSSWPLPIQLPSSHQHHRRPSTFSRQVRERGPELDPEPERILILSLTEELAPTFHDHNVKAVIRLNAPLYEGERFVAQGIAHHDLIFPDGSTPSIRIIDEFFRIVESCDGTVAVHCKGGFGRTGTLIACYMIKHHGFTAREAIGWIRLCRPGSIVGRQQQFLVTYDPRSWLADRSQLTTPPHRVEDVMRNPGRFARVLAKSKRVRQASLLPPLTMMRPSETAATQLTIEAPELDDAALPSSKPQLSLSTPSMAALQECDCNDDGVVTTVQLGAKRARDELVEESVRCSQREAAAAVLRTRY